MGVDLSESQLSTARDRKGVRGTPRESKNVYLHGDIAAFEPEQPFSVILFRESLYYLNRFQIEKVMRRYREHLDEDGVFVVVMSDVKRHTWIADLVANRFDEIEREIVAEKTIVQVLR